MKLPYRLPLAPLIPWIEECIEKDSAEGFASRCGISAKRFSDIRSGKATMMSFNNMDKMLATEGSRTIIDFFPEYVDDEMFFDPNFGKLTEQAPVTKRKCAVEGCDKIHHSKGFCDRHYRMNRKSALVV